jgi:hypothetical protein
MGDIIISPAKSMKCMKYYEMIGCTLWCFHDIPTVYYSCAIPILFLYPPYSILSLSHHFPKSGLPQVSQFYLSVTRKIASILPLIIPISSHTNLIYLCCFNHPPDQNFALTVPRSGRRLVLEWNCW